MNILFFNARILTINETFDEIENGFLYVKGDTISYIGSVSPKEIEEGTHLIDCEGKLLLPGFVNTHTHLPMTIMRGNADDLPLHRWLEEKIYPMFAHDTDESMYWGSLLGLAEMIRNGITCVNEMSPTIEAVISAVRQTGMRGIFSMGIAGAAPNGLEMLKVNKQIYDKLHNVDNERIKIGVGPHAEYSCNMEFLESCAEIANELGCRIHMHVSETRQEHEQCKERHGGKTPIQLFDSLGLVNERTVMAHCVWVDNTDMEIIADRKAAVAHNPASNLKLASGIARIKEMLDQGIKVGIGTDSCVSNNKLDMFDEMYLASLLCKCRASDASAMNARESLYLATSGGAQAIGLQETGVLAVGKKADIIMIDTSNAVLYYPNNDIYSHLVYSGNSRDVCMTMIDGNILYKDGEFTTLDVPQIKAKSQELYMKLYDGC